MEQLKDTIDLQERQPICEVLIRMAHNIVLYALEYWHDSSTNIALVPLADWPLVQGSTNIFLTPAQL